MGEEDEVKQGMGSKIGNAAKAQGKEALKKQGKKAVNKVASKFSKKFAQKATQKAATKAAMSGPMMVLMLKILVVILIIMAIIGIIMFVVTMPGMVMDKLKALFKSIGNAIASFFGQDSSVLQADEEKINEILTYLEQMGYDLKGEGFITASYTNDDVPDDKEDKWEGDKEHENTGVIRNKEDEKIVMAHSEFVFNYLISDNYVYTVKNFNIVTGDSFWTALGALFIQIGSAFGYNAGEDWGEGMIALYDEGSSVGKKGEMYESDILGWENIDVDAEARTLTIRRGWFQNKMVYSLDGWTGRYGMPLEFLLSVHLATKMPDLPYDMVKAFGGQGDDLGTEVNIVLHKLDNVSAITAYKKDFETEGTEETDYITYGEMKKIKGEGWSPTDGWTLSKKEAAKIMKLGIKSPDGCTYKDPTFEIIDHSDNGDGWIFDSDKKAELKQYGMNDSDLFADLDAELGKKAAKKTEEKFSVEEAMVEVNDETSKGTHDAWQSATDLGYVYETVQKQGGYSISDPEKFVGTEKFEGTCDRKSHKDFGIAGTSDPEWYPCGHSTGGQYTCRSLYVKKNAFFQIEKYVYEREWQANYDGKEDVTFTWVSYVYKLYRYPTKEREEGEGTYVRSYIFDYIMRDLTFDELVEKGILNPDGTAVKEQRCSNDKNLEECCSTCKNHVKKIMKLMKDGNDPDFDTYTPYIADVTNHWYRDVYFATSGNQNFVQVDQEYEALMGERWTLYETDDNGQYVLYVLGTNGNIATSADDANVKKAKEVAKVEEKDGNFEFKGTQQDANEKGVPVVKKAETIKITDTDTDGDQLIDWVKNGDVWSAYKLNGKEVSTGWQNLYEKVEKAEEDKTTEEKLKERVFLNITTSNDITQVEEGQRTATNSKIRNMFLNNIYFRYDGSPETADVIAELRKKISGSDLKFGHLTDSDLSKLTDEEKQYTGKVELTQNSLSAFSMLENTHTLDADFIYKDFKELVVELGYFTKEELSDETPRIFAWLIPEIGSGGYPIASLDKKENEYGTQAHSKEDYQANVKNTLAAAIAAATANEKSEEEKFDVSGKPLDSEAPKGIDLQTDESKELDRLVGEIKLQHEGTDDDFIVLGGLDSSKELLSLEAWWEEAQKIFDIYKKDSWLYDGHGPNGSGASHGCNAGTTFDEVNEGGREKTTDCSIGASWLLQKLGALQENHTFTSALGDAGDLDKNNVCAQDLLDAGAQVIIPTNEGISKFAAAANAGKLQPGDVLFYDGHVSIYCGDGYEAGGSKTSATHCWDTGSTTGIQCGGPRDTSYEDRDIELIVRLPFGNGGGSGDPYEGFEGGEAVVSPVTGILLEYGTYEKGKIDPVTEKELRENVDFKYINNNSEEAKDDSGNPPEPDPAPVQDVIDYVGYAKIMILDTETYLELENQMKSSAPKAIAGMTDREGNAIQSLVDKDGNYLENKALKSPDILTSEDESKKWSDKEITLYGYKEFAEMYSEFGVEGNIIFIDGFKCELPVEGGGEEKKEDDKEDDTGAPKILDGEDINKDYFENNVNNDEFDKVLYEKEERFNLSSVDATNKLNNENDIKAEADPIIKVGDKLLIKEGTIIGRTMTNDEVMAEREKNGIVTPTPKKETTEPAPGDTGKEEDTDPIVGNYLRIIMRDEDDTVVENVEEYMKLDEEGGKTSQPCDFEQFAYYLGCLLEGFNESMDQGSSYGVEVLKDGAGNTTAFGLTKGILDAVKNELPSFGSNLAAGSVPKEEAQDALILVLEAAKESIQSKLNTPLEEDDSNLFALMDLHHASPAECEDVIAVYNSKNNNLSAEEKISVFTENWGTNENYGLLLRRRGRNRGLLASEGRYFLYQEGSEGKEVIFDTETPWSDFCDAGGTYEMITESSGLYHTEANADPDYIKN